MTDRYTKIILTVIAVALCALVAQNAIAPAGAAGRECGIERWQPCYVEVVGAVRMTSR